MPGIYQSLHYTEQHMPVFTSRLGYSNVAIMPVSTNYKSEHFLPAIWCDLRRSAEAFKLET